MRIYIASQDKEQAVNLRKMLIDNTSETLRFPCRWLDQDFRRTSTYSVEERDDIASQCYNDIDHCDTLILISSEDKSKCSGGKFMEAGYALGHGKDVIVFGQPENMLLWAKKRIKVVQTPSELMLAVNILAKIHSVSSPNIEDLIGGWCAKCNHTENYHGPGGCHAADGNCTCARFESE